MSLLTRLTVPLDGEVKLPVHQVMAILAEYKRGAPGVTLAVIATAFGIAAGQEQTDLATLANLFATDVITREMIHDVLMLGESAVYSTQNCLDRILTAGTPNLTPILLKHGIDALRIGMNDFTLSGCVVSVQGSPNMTVAITKGSVMSLGVLVAVTAGNVTIPTADANLPRLDLVAISSNGTKVCRQGTPAASPSVTSYQSGDVPLSIVYVPPNTTAIDSSKLQSVSVAQRAGPITVGQVTTAVVKNTTSAQQVFITLVMPSGLFLTGRVLRVQCGGSALFNSGTPTATLAIAYGGTVMFQDVTTAATADTDRLAWSLVFYVIAQANNDQALNGVLIMSPTAAKTAATTGVGDMAIPSAITAVPVVTPINGSAAVDSDAADRTLQVAWQMNVSNVADEIVMEYATAELVC